MEVPTELELEELEMDAVLWALKGGVAVVEKTLQVEKLSPVQEKELRERLLPALKSVYRKLSSLSEGGEDHTLQGRA